MENIIKCHYCGKNYTKKGLGTHIWRSHGEGKGFHTNKGKSSWNKGLCKETDERVKKYSSSLKGKETWMKGKKHSNESKSKMSLSALESFRKGTHSSWKSRKNRSYAELYFEDVLENNGILDICEIEYPVKIKGTGSSYFLDFYFKDKKLNLEIDGAQHKRPERMESDRMRDEYLAELGITTFRIEWADPSSKREHLKIQFNEFLKLYKQK